ncbi:MAG: hypothetical protein AAGF95_14365 [Chloroflexota bacterium]
MEPPTLEKFVQSSQQTFRRYEFGDIIRTIYRFISLAVIRGRVDTVIITSTHLIWSGNGQEIVRQKQIEPPQRLSFGDAFHMVLARDSYVQNFVHLVKSTPTEEVYHIGIEPPATSSESDDEQSQNLNRQP